MENGLVQVSSTPKPLKYTLDGWQDISIIWERNMEKLGVVRNFSLPLGAVIDARKIIRHVLFTGNFDRKLFLLIKDLKLFIDPSTYYFYYDFLYKGEFDLTTFESGPDKAVTQIMEGGLIQKLQANQDTVYEFLPDELEVKLDGIVLNKALNFILVDDLEIAKTVYGDNHFAPVTNVQNEGLATSIVPVSQDLQDTSGMSFAAKIADDTNYLAKNIGSTPVTIQVEGHVKFHVTANDLGTWGYRMRFLTSSLSLPLQNDYEIFSQTVIANGADYDFTVSKAVILMPGDLLHLEGIFFGGASGEVAIKYLPDSKLTASYEYRAPATNAGALRLHTLFKRLVEKITGNSDDGASDLLNVTYPNVVVTSGDAIRRIDGAKIKTSFTDFFKTVRAIFAAGEGIMGGKIRVETHAFFLNAGLPAIELGEANSEGVTDKVAKELLFNKVSIGYPEQDYDDVNGKQEFNNTSRYSTVILRATKELELLSQYRADCYGIEFLRMNTEGKDTTDTSSDNDVFLLDIELEGTNVDGSYNLRRINYDTIEGLLQPSSVFNIELSPARMLKRWMPWIAGCCTGFEGTNLTFQTTEKNHELKTVEAGETFDEDADVPIDGSVRLFKAIIFELQPAGSISLAETMEDNPNQYFQFTHNNGQVYKGFNLKAGLSPDTLKEEAFQLLAAADTDLTTLV